MSSFETLIDPVQDPDRANASVDTLINDRTPPMLPAPPSGMVDLFLGLPRPNGGFDTEAKIRELNGADEERIARATQNTTLSPEKFIDLILTGNVEEIGGKKPDRDALLGLLTGDRAHLALEIRKLTFGNEWEVRGMICRFCQQTFDVVVELDRDIKYRKVSPIDGPIEVALRNGIAKIRLVNGADEIYAMYGDKTIPEQTTAYIDRCLISIDGNSVGPGVAKTMGVSDRAAIVRALRENAPGPELDTVTIPCEFCKKEADYAVSIVDLFRL